MKHLPPFLLLTLTSFLFLSCADDLKGPAGEPGTSINGAKPIYEQKEPDQTSVLIPASPTKPARVTIDGVILENTATLECELTQNGINGLDQGNLTEGEMYYLYAIPVEEETTFASVASLNDPNQGPTDYSSWSYLGAFRISPVGVVTPFTHHGGGITYHHRVPLISTSTIPESLVQVLPNQASEFRGNGKVIPSTANHIFLWAAAGSPSPGGNNPDTASYNRGSINLFADPDANHLVRIADWEEVGPDEAPQSSGSVHFPLNDEGSFYYDIVGPADGESWMTFSIAAFGFIENPAYWP